MTGLNLRARATLATEVHWDLAAVTRAVSKNLAWTAAEADAFTDGMRVLRAEWAARGGTPLPTP